MGDIHGNFRALKQCLELTKFDYENENDISMAELESYRKTNYNNKNMTKIIKDSIHSAINC